MNTIKLISLLFIILTITCNNSLKVNLKQKNNDSNIKERTKSILSNLEDFISSHLDDNSNVKSQNNKQIYIIAGETNEEAIFITPKEDKENEISGIQLDEIGPEERVRNIGDKITEEVGGVTKDVAGVADNVVDETTDAITGAASAVNEGAEELNEEIKGQTKEQEVAEEIADKEEERLEESFEKLDEKLEEKAEESKEEVEDN